MTMDPRAMDMMAEEEKTEEKPDISSGETLKDKTYRPHDRFTHLTQKPPQTQATRRMARGRLGFLKHVNPSKVDLALKYVKLEPMVPLAEGSTNNDKKLRSRDTRRCEGHEVRIGMSGEQSIPVKVVESDVYTEEDETRGRDKESDDSFEMAEVNESDIIIEQKQSSLSSGPIEDRPTDDMVSVSAVSTTQYPHIFRDPEIADIACLLVDIRDTLIFRTRSKPGE